MFVCITSYRGELAIDDPILEEHWAFLDAELARGRLVASGPQEPRVGGVMLLQAADEVEAHGIVGRDPLVVEGRIDYELLQFHPSRALHQDLIEGAGPLLTPTQGDEP